MAAICTRLCRHLPLRHPMSKESLPEMHYMSEHERVKVHPAVICCISIASVPSNFPFNLPLSADRQYRGPRFTIGWLEFQSPDQPDPDVARPGDVWVQLPSGNRKARVYVCYSTKGKVWSPWAGNNVSLAARGSVPTHPFLNDHPQRKFYLIFNGSQFIWANPKAISNIMHANRQLSKMSPAEAAIKWLKETGVGRTSASPVETDVHSTSVQQVNRKRAHPDQSEPPGDLVSEPAEKKTRDNPSFQQTNETSPNARPVVILQLPYQRPQVQGGAASAAQPRVTHKALEQQTLHMRIPSASFGVSNCDPFQDNYFVAHFILQYPSVAMPTFAAAARSCAMKQQLRRC